MRTLPSLTFWEQIMASLRDTRVKRGGITSRYWFRDPETDDVELLSEKELELSFSISSKGGGNTALSITIGSKDFSALLEGMSSADRHAAIVAMSKELRRQVLLQPLREKGSLAEGRLQVLALVKRKYERASIGKDDHERTLMDGVEQLVQQLNAVKRKKP